MIFIRCNLNISNENCFMILEFNQNIIWPVLYEAFQDPKEKEIIELFNFNLDIKAPSP